MGCAHLPHLLQVRSKVYYFKCSVFGLHILYRTCQQLVTHEVMYSLLYGISFFLYKHVNMLPYLYERCKQRSNQKKNNQVCDFSLDIY